MCRDSEEEIWWTLQAFRALGKRLTDTARGRAGVGEKNEAPKASQSPPDFPETVEAPPDDFRPLWKSEFKVSMQRFFGDHSYEEVPTLADSGCDKCCM